MYNIGDKVVYISGSEYHSNTFTKGHIYEIVDTRENHYGLPSKFGGGVMFPKKYFNDYFVTIKEYRKLKLEKLNSL